MTIHSNQSNVSLQHKSLNPFAFVGHHTNLINFCITCNAEAWSPTIQPCELVPQELTFDLFKKPKLFIPFLLAVGRLVKHLQC
jgi:hypothetical protein